MLDPIAISALATSVVSVLSPLLHKALDKGVEELGKSTAGSLFEKLKLRLSHAGAGEALDDLGKQPDDADTQAALRLQLKKALASEAELAADLQKWIMEAKDECHMASVVQQANVTGDNSKVVQIHGSGNSVG
ncbi:hypothetical protein AAKU55_004191 [Oxalobacteraceae bacterium GrIS 1.11]